MIYYTLFMKKQIALNKRKVDYTLRLSKRARRMRLAIYRDGAFVVTAPWSINQNIIEQFIIKKSQWVLDKLDYFKKFSGYSLVKSNGKDFSQNKKAALALAKERIEHFNNIYEFKFNKVNIKNQKTRWGSCSSLGNLNFNYKIALLSQQLSDYIIVHELCHLGEFNHSPKFWNLVAKSIPDYFEIKNELKRSGVNFY